MHWEALAKHEHELDSRMPKQLHMLKASILNYAYACPSVCTKIPAQQQAKQVWQLKRRCDEEGT